MYKRDLWYPRTRASLRFLFVKASLFFSFYNVHIFFTNINIQYTEGLQYKYRRLYTVNRRFTEHSIVNITEGLQYTVYCIQYTELSYTVYCTATYTVCCTATWTNCKIVKHFSILVVFRLGRHFPMFLHEEFTLFSSGCVTFFMSLR